jgi:acyl-CoA reductase-like NAD-dependent aldehyde dehydrogenase
VARGREEGAHIITGGERAPYQGALRGYWMEPTIFDAVEPEHTIARDEIFGPVLAILPFRTEEEAIDLANRTVYGLAAGLWTRDVTRAHRVARQLEAGTVWINLYHNLDAASPFGGIKESGFGRELGASSLDFYTQEKSVWVKLE